MAAEAISIFKFCFSPAVVVTIISYLWAISYDATGPLALNFSNENLRSSGINQIHNLTVFCALHPESTRKTIDFVYFGKTLFGKYFPPKIQIGILLMTVSEHCCFFNSNDSIFFRSAKSFLFCPLLIFP